MRLKKKIALIFAMEVEAQPLIQDLKLTRLESFGDPRLPFLHYTGHFEAFEILLSVNGKDRRYGVDNIGTEPATLNAYVTLSQFKPDLCINAGTAGGFLKRQAEIGDVYLSVEAFRFHDRRIPIPGFDVYGVGHYPTLQVSQMARALRLKEGVVTTANSIDYTSKDMEMMEKNNGAVKEMEAAGIAWVAHLLGIPLFALKSITDFVDSHHPTQEQFLRNLEVACQNLRIKTLEVLQYLSAHPDRWNTGSY